MSDLSQTALLDRDIYKFLALTTPLAYSKISDEILLYTLLPKELCLIIANYCQDIAFDIMVNRYIKCHDPSVVDEIVNVMLDFRESSHVVKLIEMTTNVKLLAKYRLVIDFLDYFDDLVRRRVLFSNDHFDYLRFKDALQHRSLSNELRAKVSTLYSESKVELSPWQLYLIFSEGRQVKLDDFYHNFKRDTDFYRSSSIYR